MSVSQIQTDRAPSHQATHDGGYSFLCVTLEIVEIEETRHDETRQGKTMPALSRHFPETLREVSSGFSGLPSVWRLANWYLYLSSYIIR